MPETYKAAVIGCGAAQASGQKGGGHQIGYLHAKTLKDHPRTELAAAADINADNLAAFQQAFEVEHGFAGYEEMIREVEPDIVTIATYVGLHRPMIEACAKAGVKGIFCEKPFLGAPADLARIETLAKETGVKIAVAHIRRQLIAFRRAQKRYNDGTVGEPVLCMAGIKGWDLTEWGGHWLDMFRMFHNDAPATWVFGQARVRGARGYGHAMEDHGMAYFEFEGGAKGLLDGGGGLNGPDTMTLTGSEGVIHVRGEHTLLIENGGGRAIEDYEDHEESDFHWTWRKTISDLIDWMEGAEEPALGHTNMLKTAELNLAAYLSCLRQDRVDLPLEDASLDEWPVETLARLWTEQG